MSHPHFHIRQISGLFGFSRQAFYQHKNRQLTTEECDQQVLALIEQIRKDHPRLGGKKLYDLLKKELMERGIKMGRAGSPLRRII